MKPSTYRRAFVQSAITLAALAAVPLLARAQDESRQPVPQPGGNVLTLKCCQCTGRELSDVQINTGVAPWKLTSGPTSLLPGPQPNIPAAWASASGATWVGPSATAGSAGAAPGVYVYQLRVVVPTCMIRSTITIKGKYWADNHASMAITGATGAVISTTTAGVPNPGYGFVQANFGSFSAALPQGYSGTVTLTITVNNTSGPTGLLVSGLVAQRCATDGAGPPPIDLPPTKTE